MAAPYYVTTPIYYVNDLPHIGHVYTTIVADVLARYHRMRGEDERFLTGTDEHGINIQRAAARAGVAPIDLANRVVARYHELWPRLRVTNDDFIRTTEPRHRAGVQRLWRRMRDAGDVYKGAYSGWYCASCETFYPESQLVAADAPGVAPAEGSGRPERSGTSGAPGANARWTCPVHEKPVEWLEEESYFFRLSRWQQPLLDHYRAPPEFIQPDSRRNEVVSFVASGLKDLSISRATLSWGVPAPDEPGHVVYVWLDALTNYVSALGYGSEDQTLYHRYWAREAPGPTAQTAPAKRIAPAIHLVGKDILRFHAVYWPAFLLSAGEPLPRTVWAHGWWLSDEKKMSKTVGNVVRPGPLLEVFGADALRWFLLREMTFGLDSSFSWDALLERTNADLANNLGNLLSRVVTLISRRPGGRIEDAPAFPPAAELRARGAEADAAFHDAFVRCDFSAALAAVSGLLGEVNRFLVVHQPWKPAPGAEATAPAVLAEAAAALRMAAVWIAPVVPRLAAEIWRQLGLDADPSSGRFEDVRWEQLPRGPVRPGGSLYTRLEREPALARLETLAQAENAAAASIPASESQGDTSMQDEPSDRIPGSPGTPPTGGGTGGPAPASPGPGLITIDQFLATELRVARVQEAERVPNADKLLRLVVDLGTETRQIVAGIATAYAPEALVGKSIIVVANLKPARLRGIESQGMLLAADVGGKPMIATFEVPVPPGTRVR